MSWAFTADPRFRFDADHRAPLSVVHRASRAYQRRVFAHVVQTVEAVVIEAGRPLFGRLHGYDPVAEARALQEHGVRVALLWHGTDIRVPSVHAATHLDSPFSTGDARTRALEAVALRNRRRATAFEGPVLVSTPDLLPAWPGARWCPVVVDVEAWASDAPLLARERPLVVHAPSNRALKGTDLVEAAMAALEGDQLVSYREVAGVPAAEVRDLYRTADVVLDQFRLGIYGVAACEAMAAGRVVVSQVDDQVRAAVAATGCELPVRDTAAELLALYAQRAAREGFAFNLPLNDYEAFAEGFGFEETADQAAAIQAVISDMTSGRPMDRLVCGDVGFGKTEVALRAAFLAVANGKQVALLCPTTLLAEQHAQTFTDRFADWPVRVVELSRFRSAKEVSAAIEGINDGRVDIVIGTHKILSKDVKFKRLGLVIIDEEHRFGVRQKEALKSLRAEVDVLTLTATPIPRTLGMSLEGIRDFSVIATAPQKRLAIKTFVRREDGSTLREALLRELKRGGQCYFLHNEVETIHNRRARLEELVPEARIAVAHGQMPER